MLMDTGLIFVHRIYLVYTSNMPFNFIEDVFDDLFRYEYRLGSFKVNWISEFPFTYSIRLPIIFSMTSSQSRRCSFVIPSGPGAFLLGNMSSTSSTSSISNILAPVPPCFISRFEVFCSRCSTFPEF